MTEGWAKKYLSDEREVRSAGIVAHGLNIIKAMNEFNIDISDQKLEIIDSEVLSNAIIAVTFCGDSADKCPMTPPHVKKDHWGFDDTAKADGTDEEKWEVFQRVRDEIGNRIKQFEETGKKVRVFVTSGYHWNTYHHISI